MLVGDERGNNGVKKLQKLLSECFLKHPPSTHGFNPHLTMLYDKLELAPEPIEPMFWTVKEITFVRSEVGETKYHFLKNWRLAA